MSRRDYVAIAAAFADSRRVVFAALVHKNAALAALDHAIYAMAGVFERDNPRFDRERFYAAASYETDFA